MGASSRVLYQRRRPRCGSLVLRRRRGRARARELPARGRRESRVRRSRPATVAALRRDGLVRGGRFGAHPRRARRLRRRSRRLDELGRRRRRPAAADFVLACREVVRLRGRGARARRARPRDRRARAASSSARTAGAPPTPSRARSVPSASTARASSRASSDRSSPVSDVTAHAEPVAVGSLFGAPPGAAEPLCAALRARRPPGGDDRPAERAPRAKLLYNGCLNPLGAICGVPYGALGERPRPRAP